MKKSLTVVVAIALALLMAAPAMATDVSFSGAYRFQGWWAENLSLDDRDADDAVMTHRLRMQTKFDVTDMLAVTTRFDAMDGRYWGVADGAGAAASDFDWDRNWMTIRTGDYGVFDIGRMAGGAWGTSFIDNVGNADRIKWTYTGVENWTFLIIYEKAAETDGGGYTARVPTAGQPQIYPTGLQADQDIDNYYGAFVYKQETWSAGLLYAFTNDKATNAAMSRKQHSFLPYFTANWGAFNLIGELRWNTGDWDADPSILAADIDIRQWAFNLEGDYNFGPATLMLGVAFTSGEDLDATKSTNAGGFGADWSYPLYILAGNDNPWSGSLGQNAGNLSVANYGGGALMFYGELAFNPLENVRLAAALGFSTADETEAIANLRTPGAQVDDDQGAELDLILDWKIYDNLNYHLVAAWMWAGDYWRDAGGIPDANFDDAKGIFHQLVLSF